MSQTKNTVINILSQLESQDDNDPRISEQLDDIVHLLTEDENETIQIIESLDENQLAWIAPTFEELSFTFQSSLFIKCIENLAKKFPDIPEIEEEVRVAKEVLE